ncbi:MAG: hypothetical protein AB7O97_04035 [Planctomycetota bacterium]
MTFHDKDVARALKARFVEARLHMDGDDRVDPELLAIHRRLQQELIGSRAVPHYAILDPTNGDFLFRSHLRGGNPAGWKEDFLAMFRRLPERPVQK